MSDAHHFAMRLVSSDSDSDSSSDDENETHTLPVAWAAHPLHEAWGAQSPSGSETEDECDSQTQPLSSESDSQTQPLSSESDSQTQPLSSESEGECDSESDAPAVNLVLCGDNHFPERNMLVGESRATDAPSAAAHCPDQIAEMGDVASRGRDGGTTLPVVVCLGDNSTEDDGVLRQIARAADACGRQGGAVGWVLGNHDIESFKTLKETAWYKAEGGEPECLKYAGQILTLAEACAISRPYLARIGLTSPHMFLGELNVRLSPGVVLVAASMDPYYVQRQWAPEKSRKRRRRHRPTYNAFFTQSHEREDGGALTRLARACFGKRARMMSALPPSDVVIVASHANPTGGMAEWLRTARPHAFVHGHDHCNPGPAMCGPVPTLNAAMFDNKCGKRGKIVVNLVRSDYATMPADCYAECVETVLPLRLLRIERGGVYSKHYRNPNSTASRARGLVLPTEESEWTQGEWELRVSEGKCALDEPRTP